MKAFAADQVGQGLQSASVREIDTPAAAPSRVAVKAVSLNAADLKVLEWRDGGNFVHGKCSPYIVGYDFAGVTDDGDEVFGFLAYSGGTKTGSLAEYVLADPKSLGKKPADVSFVDAACLGTAGATALQGLRDKLGVQTGQRVLVHGASGGVGTFAVQIAKIMGAEVVGTCSPAKAEAVKALGADEVVDYRSTPIDQIRGPFDAVFDAAAKSSYGECKAILGPKGGYLTLLPSLGLVTGIIATLFSGRSCSFVAVKSVPADLEQLAAWVVEGKLRVELGGRFALADAQQAIDTFAAGSAAGKIAITVP